MERFARLIVAGGLALVAGLWLVTVSGAWDLPWPIGPALVALGAAGLAGGIWSELDYYSSICKSSHT